MLATTLMAITLAALGAGSTSRPAPAVAAPPAVDATVKPERRYCVRSASTGSNIRVTRCRTRGQWLAMGVDPLEPTR